MSAALLWTERLCQLRLKALSCNNSGILNLNMNTSIGIFQGASHIFDTVPSFLDSQHVNTSEDVQLCDQGISPW